MCRSLPYAAIVASGGTLHCARSLLTVLQARLTKLRSKLPLPTEPFLSRFNYTSTAAISNAAFVTGAGTVDVEELRSALSKLGIKMTHESVAELIEGVSQRRSSCRTCPPAAAIASYCLRLVVRLACFEAARQPAIVSRSAQLLHASTHCAVASRPKQVTTPQLTQASLPVSPQVAHDGSGAVEFASYLDIMRRLVHTEKGTQHWIPQVCSPGCRLSPSVCSCLFPGLRPGCVISTAAGDCLRPASVGATPQ